MPRSRSAQRPEQKGAKRLWGGLPQIGHLDWPDIESLPGKAACCKAHPAGAAPGQTLLVATDLEFTRGDGPEVTGPAEAILLAATGRSVALEDLDGEGVVTLRSRMPSTP